LAFLELSAAGLGRCRIELCPLFLSELCPLFLSVGGWSAGRRFGVKRFKSPGHESGFYPAFFTIGPHVPKSPKMYGMRDSETRNHETPRPRPRFQAEMLETPRIPHPPRANARENRRRPGPSIRWRRRRSIWPGSIFQRRSTMPYWKRRGDQKGITFIFAGTRIEAYPHLRSPGHAASAARLGG
jgi:hypothetical protein